MWYLYENFTQHVMMLIKQCRSGRDQKNQCSDLNFDKIKEFWLHY